MEACSAPTGQKSSSKSRYQHHHTPQIKEADLGDGRLLLGSPTFTDLGNGRLRCIESGHDLQATDKDRYALSKACLLALIDSALARNIPPLNIFNPNPLFKSKLVCKLTGDTINKTEEHIWKHINGKRFLNKLEQKEVEKMGTAEESGKKSRRVIVVKKDKDHEYEDGDLEREMAELGIGNDDGSIDEEAAGLGGSDEGEETCDEESGGGSHDVAPPGGSSARREGKAPAFEVRRQVPGSAVSAPSHSLRDPEEVRSLLAALVTPDFSRTLGSELLRDPRRLQDAGVVETLSGLLKTVLAQGQGSPSGVASAGSSISAGRQRFVRRAEVAEAEAAALRTELARERRRREAAVRRLAEAGLQEEPLTGRESERSRSGDQEESRSGRGESGQASAGGREETSTDGDESERSSSDASED